MKLHLDARKDLNLITGYGSGHVELNRQSRFERSVIVLPDRVVENWGANGFSGLTPDDFVELAALAPGILLLGTGSRQRFPAPALLRPLIEAKLAFEIMDLGAACRTFNILTGEGRHVAAALLLDDKT